jgi:hypothetical protein
MNSSLLSPCIFLLLLQTTLHAQTSLGVEGGLSNNRYETNISNRASTVLTNYNGIYVGLPFRYAIHPWLYLTTTPGLVQKGYSMDRTDSLYGEFDQHVNTYLQLPVGVSFVYNWRRLRVSLDLGVYTGYWLSGRVKGKTANIFNITDNIGANGQTSESFLLSDYSNKYSFLSERDNRWEFGWNIGPGLYYHLAGHCWLTGGARLYQSLTSQQKKAVSPIPAYNQNWIWSIGGLWTLDKL